MRIAWAFPDGDVDTVSTGGTATVKFLTNVSRVMRAMVNELDEEIAA